MCSSHLPAVVTIMLCCDSHTLSFKGQGLQASQIIQEDGADMSCGRAELHVMHATSKAFAKQPRSACTRNRVTMATPW